MRYEKLLKADLFIVSLALPILLMFLVIDFLNEALITLTIIIVGIVLFAIGINSWKEVITNQKDIGN
jgi:hypothetical protein